MQKKTGEKVFLIFFINGKREYVREKDVIGFLKLFRVIQKFIVVKVALLKSII